MVAIAVVGLLIGLLFGTGVIGVSKKDDDQADSDHAGEGGGRGKSRRGGGGGDDKEIADLDSLGYINSVPIKKKDRGKKGVVRSKAGKFSDGLFLVNPSYASKFKGKGGPVHEVQLWSMEGKLLHKWALRPPDRDYKKKGFAIGRVDDDGYLYVVVADHGVFKYDWNGDEVWAAKATYHHDMNFDVDGTPILVTEQRRNVPYPRPEGEDDESDTIKILDHGVTWVSRETGEVERRIWLYDTFKDDDHFRNRLRRFVRRKEKKHGSKAASRRAIDVFHLNAVQAAPMDIDGVAKKGDILVSARHMDTIAIVDAETGELKWSWGPDELEQQHDPTFTDDGKIVVFDNGNTRGFSRALIVDPKTNEIVRDFNGGEKEKFFSGGRGLAEMVEGGNMFITVSNEARIIEVTPDDEVVWEFFGPWTMKDRRFPIRAARLQGKPAEVVQGILDESIEAPVGKAGAGAAEEDGTPEDGDDAKDDDAKDDDAKKDDAKKPDAKKPAPPAAGAAEDEGSMDETGS